MLHTAEYLTALRIQNALAQLRFRGLVPIRKGDCYTVSRCPQCGKAMVLGGISAADFAISRLSDATFTICFHCWQIEDHKTIELTPEDEGHEDAPLGHENHAGAYEDDGYGYGSGEPYEDEQQRLIDQYGEGGFETDDGHFFPESWTPS
jgi:hypothetical protein